MSDAIAAVPLEFTEAAANKVKFLIADEDNPELKLRGILPVVVAADFSMVLPSMIKSTTAI